MLTLLKSSGYLIYCSVLTLENPVSFYRVYLCVVYWMLKQTETYEYVVYGIKGFIL
jgi:hypothetical protein